MAEPLLVLLRSLWQTPYLVAGTRLHDRLERAGGFVRAAGGGLLDVGVHFVAGYDGPVHVIDWTNPEAVAWSRSGWAGAQRLPVHWGGDVPPAWETMLPQLHGGLSLGLSGFTFWSADIVGTGELPRSILVAPLLEPGGRRLVGLPPGTWTERWVEERPTDPLTGLVAPFEGDGRTELAVPVDGREVTVRYRAEAGRHTVEVSGHHGEVVLEAPPEVEMRR